MADPNRLEIIAELIDKISAPARRMQKAFDDLSKSTTKNLPEAFKKYQQAVAANEKALASYGKRSEWMRREFNAFQVILRRTSPMVGESTIRLTCARGRGRNEQVSPAATTRGLGARGYQASWSCAPLSDPAGSPSRRRGVCGFLIGRRPSYNFRNDGEVIRDEACSCRFL
jgi:hypothetical protein